MSGLLVVIPSALAGGFVAWRVRSVLAWKAYDQVLSGAATRVRILKAEGKQAQSERDGLFAAVADARHALASGDLDKASAVLDMAIQEGDYPDRLQAARRALVDAKREITEMQTGRPVSSVEDHADQIIGILRDDAVRDEPSATGLDLIYSHTRRTP